MMNITTTNTTTMQVVQEEEKEEELHTNMNMMIMSPGALFFEEICPEDVVGKILLFCDFVSAITFVRCTNKVLKERYYENNSTTDLIHVWLEIYHRHGFCPPPSSCSSSSCSSSSSSLGKVVDSSIMPNNAIVVSSPKKRQYDLNIHLRQQRKKQQESIIITETLLRRRLLMNLFQQSNNNNKKKKKNSSIIIRQCLNNLPQRHFKFLPILPSNIMDIDYEEHIDLLHFDPPPIFYECDSFVLTSSGNGSELVLLNPFDGTLSVLQNIQDYCISSSSKEDEGMIQQLWSSETATASSSSSDDDGGGSPMTNNHDLAVPSTAASSSYHNHHSRREEQQLLDSNDYFQFDIAPYFPNGDVVQLTNEYELSFMGIDAKPILLDNNPYNNSASAAATVGSMIGIGRSVRNIQENDIVCTELTAWKRLYHDVGIVNNNQQQHDGYFSRSNNNNYYGRKMLCRFPWMFHLVDMDTNNERFFVSFYKGDGPFGHVEAQEEEDAASDNNTATTTISPSSRLIVYPMIGELDDDDDYDVESCNGKGLSTHDNSSNSSNSNNNNRNGPTNNSSTSRSSNSNKYFPEPLLTIDCGDSVSSFILDATGNTLIVTTSCGNLQLWNVTASNNKQHQQQQQRAHLIQQIPLLKALKSSIKSCILSQSQPLNTAKTTADTATQKTSRTDTDTGHDDDGVDNRNGTSSFAALRQHMETARFQGPVNSILVSKHASLLKDSPRDGRFVTLHRHQNDGTSLLLWQQRTNQIVSLINLPLSPRRSPRVFYEGNRIIVFGEDHIGMIILVYAVCCNDLLDTQRQQDKDMVVPSVGEETSGGVYNLTSPPVVQFVNRIRHVALGGIDSFDSIHMTCNERYLIVNTRTGNLLGECPYPEGLLVIDLQD